MQSSNFRQRYDTALDLLASNVDRICVGVLPERVRLSMKQNMSMLQACSHGLTEDDQGFIVSMLNESWLTELPPTGRISHYCHPECCRNTEECNSRMRRTLDLLLGHLFEVPLLYRWKHFEPALHFVARGLAAHSVLCWLWGQCLSNEQLDGEVDDIATMSEDNPDVAPSLRQKIRVTKVMKLLRDELALVTFAKGLRIDASHGAGTLLDLTQMTTPIGAASTDGGTLSGGCGGGKDDSEPNDEDKPGVQINLKDPSSDSGSFEMLSSTSDSWEIPQSAIIVEHPSNGMNMPDATSDVEFESLGTTPPASPIPERAMPTPAPGPPEGKEVGEERFALAAPFCGDWGALRLTALLRSVTIQMVLMRLIFQPGATATKQREDYEKAQLLVQDVLCELPASSVEVEKSHANVQTDLKPGHAKRPQTVQLDSYIQSVVIEHSRLKASVEDEVLGSAKRKVARCLRQRLLESSAPGATLSNTSTRFSTAALAKRNPGVLKGLLSGPHSIARFLLITSYCWGGHLILNYMHHTTVSFCPDTQVSEMWTSTKRAPQNPPAFCIQRFPSGLQEAWLSLGPPTSFVGFCL
ncbi:unnamed protein product [Durusdinium trenchii]|uniref:Uncharacterized protein n=1 Tax=Durusdinium trenchii TaxID=1381693 RepID=A0ABP0KNV9_9DINO